MRRFFTALLVFCCGCGVEHSGVLELGVRYVVYRDSSGKPIQTRDETAELFQRVNAIWRVCDIAFRVDDYLAVETVTYGLNYYPANYSEIVDLRGLFDVARSFVIVTTGSWDRTGSLGFTAANAWTAMPGGEPYGIILEQPVAGNAGLIAHELGHYLGLRHVSDNAFLMNPLIYETSISISVEECATARAVVDSYWSEMLR